MAGSSKPLVVWRFATAIAGFELCRDQFGASVADRSFVGAHHPVFALGALQRLADDEVGQLSQGRRQFVKQVQLAKGYRQGKRTELIRDRTTSMVA